MNNLTKSEWISLLTNPNIESKLIDELLNSKVKRMPEYVSESPTATGEQLAKIYANINKAKLAKVYSVRDNFILCDYDTSLDRIGSTIKNIAGHPNTPANILIEIFTQNKKNKDILNNLLENRNVPNVITGKFLKKKTKAHQPKLETLAWWNPNPDIHLQLIEMLNDKSILFSAHHASLSSSLFNQLLDTYNKQSPEVNSVPSFLRSKHCTPADEKRIVDFIKPDYDQPSLYNYIVTVLEFGKNLEMAFINKYRNQTNKKLRELAYKNRSQPVIFDDISFEDPVALKGSLGRADVPPYFLSKAIDENILGNELVDLLNNISYPAEIIDVFINKGILENIKKGTHPDLVERLLFSISFTRINMTNVQLKKVMPLFDDYAREKVITNSGFSYTDIRQYIGLDTSNEDSIATFQRMPSWYKEIAETVEFVEYTKLINDKSRNIYIPGFTESVSNINDVIGVIGGYFFKSAHGATYIKEGFGPIVQVDLKKLSHLYGYDFGTGILEVWGSDGDWGQGNPATCVVNPLEAFHTNADLSFEKYFDEGEDANQFELGQLCHGWDNASYNDEPIDLSPPLFISSLKYIGPNILLENYNKENRFFIDKLLKSFNKEQYLSIIRYSLNMAFGITDAECYRELRDEVKLLGDDFDDGLFEIQSNDEWLFLLSMDGPVSGTDVEDNYTVFLNRKTKECKAYARRFMY
jgi:hypothetical protein